MTVCATKHTKLSHQIHCAAVKRQPQQPKSWQSPCLRVTLVGGMRYLCTLPSRTEDQSSPEDGTAVRVRIQSLPPPGGMGTRS